ncbi:MAG: LamG domain-containing protein, partial [Muribaculaceae bacterium]|nr:LamG domain-containing protein [Muribaculaceae bacterium]
GWMNGDYYYWMVNKNYPAGYPTGMRCDYDYAETINAYADQPVFKADYGMKPVAGGETIPVSMPKGNEFTLSLTASVSHDSYKGELFSSSNLSYGINEANALPYLVTGNGVAKSTNRFYTSDNWAYNSNGTNSDNWPTKLGTFTLTVTSDGETVTVYRNGLIDQKVRVSLPEIGDLKIGGFDGAVGAVTVYDHCLSQDEVKYALHSSALESVDVPETVVTDLVLPSKINGETVSWISSKPEIIGNDGIFMAPEVATEVVLTATLGGHSKTYQVTAMPRDIDMNLLVAYDFEPEDLTESDGVRKVRDLSGNGRDLLLEGSSKIDGTLNLKSNTSTGFAGNGYAVIPEGLLKGVRSYTVAFTAEAISLAAAPRFYDMGSNSGNSLFFRVNTPAAGIKYAGGTTTFTEAGDKFTTDTRYALAVTFDASTHMTTIYANGEPIASGVQNVNEPYMLVETLADSRNYIGRTQWWDSSYGKDNGDFVGSIDDFRMYNTALTASEIKALQGFADETPELNKDCTELIANPDFEGAFSIAQGTGVDADRAIYLPEGWETVYVNGNNYDMSIVDATCLYADLFSSVPALPDGGAKTYRIRQRWGSSTLGLSQQLDRLPAGFYRVSASAWVSDKGGSASIFAQSSADGKRGAAVVPGAGWMLPEVMFVCDGVECPRIGFESVHSVEVELLSGFDNFKLADVTANRSVPDLKRLLGIMTERASQLLGGTLPKEI